MSEAGDKMVRCARKYIGVPHAHMGRSAHGMDCVGLVVLASRDAGFPVGDIVEGYAEWPRNDRLERELESRMDRVEAEDQKPGDIVTMWFLRKSKFAQHLAIVTDRGIIHCDGFARATPDAFAGRVVEHSPTRKQAERFKSYFRLKGAADG